MARTLGIVLGGLGFVVDNVTYTESETVVDIGDIELEAEQKESLRIAPIAAGGAVIVGVGFVLYGMNRERSKP